jgi:hypothetical protein
LNAAVTTVSKQISRRVNLIQTMTNIDGTSVDDMRTVIDREDGVDQTRSIALINANLQTVYDYTLELSKQPEAKKVKARLYKMNMELAVVTKFYNTFFRNGAV